MYLKQFLNRNCGRFYFLHPKFRILCLFDVIVLDFIDSWFFTNLGKIREDLKLDGEVIIVGTMINLGLIKEDES